MNDTTQNSYIFLTHLLTILESKLKKALEEEKVLSPEESEAHRMRRVFYSAAIKEIEKVLSNYITQETLNDNIAEMVLTLIERVANAEYRESTLATTAQIMLSLTREEVINTERRVAEQIAEVERRTAELIVEAERRAIYAEKIAKDASDGKTDTLEERAIAAEQKVAELLEFIRRANIAADAEQRAAAKIRMATIDRTREAERRTAEQIAEVKKIAAEQIAEVERRTAEQIAVVERRAAEQIAAELIAAAERRAAKQIAVERIAAEQITAAEKRAVDAEGRVIGEAKMKKRIEFAAQIAMFTLAYCVSHEKILIILLAGILMLSVFSGTVKHTTEKTVHEKSKGWFPKYTLFTRQQEIEPAQCV